MATVRLELAAADGTGESIVWDERDEALWWVDITGRRVHRLEPASGKHALHPAPDIVTSLGLRADGGLILGLRSTIVRWDGQAALEPANLEVLATPEPDMPENRLNEGVVGPDGAFWVGTMQNNIAEDGTAVEIEHSSGGLHRLAADGGLTRLSRPEYGITNTMAWPDERTFLLGDTLADTIYAFDRDPGTGALTNRRPFAAGFGRGLPDGSCLDAEGYLWNCRFGGGCVVRFTPDGAVDRVLELPCTSPTTCTFGGPERRTLFITSARFGVDPAQVRANPSEGGLFALEVGVAGRPEHRFAQA